MIKFPNPWAKFPWGGPPTSPSLFRLTFPFPLSSFPPLHLFHFPYLQALISDLLLILRLQFLQLRLSIAVYIPFFLLCRDYLPELILHWSRWKQFRWRETARPFEHYRYGPTQGHIVFPLSFRRTHFAQCNQFVTLLYSSRLWRTTRRLNSSMHRKHKRSSRDFNFLNEPKIQANIPPTPPLWIIAANCPAEDVVAQLSIMAWQHSPHCKVACGVRKVLPPASSLPTTNPIGSKHRFYLPLITEPAEIPRSAALSSYQWLKKRNSLQRKLMPVLNTKALA